MSIRRLGWTSRELTKNSFLDKQNHKLVEHVNTFIDMLNNGTQAPGSTQEFISMLSNHATYCFGNENSLMVTLEFESRNFHLKEHERFFEMIEIFRKESDTPDIQKKIITFLRNWKKNHIKVLDRVLAEELKTHEED